MDIINDLAGVDLNLLVVLRALLEDRSVTRAAQRLGRSQPAVSNALARLRQQIGDPLLVREGQEMVPTSRALALAGPVSEALDRIHGTLAPPPPFDPARTDRVFRIAADDLVACSVVAPGLAALRHQAPGATLELWPAAPEAPVEALGDGTLDLSVGVYLDVPAPLAWRDLALHRFVVLARADHPAIDGGLDLDRYVAAEHVLVSSRGVVRSVVDYVLSTLGRRRRVVLTVPQFLAVPPLLATTDIIATVPDLVAASLPESAGLVAVPAPIELPVFPLRAVWHRRRDGDAGLHWLIDRLSDPAGAQWKV
ncbi:MAG: LysR family transcriptional regulator [Myxococcota bacterium]